MISKAEAREYVEKVHTLSTAAVNPVVTSVNRNLLKEIGLDRPRGHELNEDEVKLIAGVLVGLEAEGRRILNEELAALRIIRADGNGPSTDEKDVDFNTLAKVAEVVPLDKIVWVPDDEDPNTAHRVNTVSYLAHGEKYDAAVIRKTDGKLRHFFGPVGMGTVTLEEGEVIENIKRGVFDVVKSGYEGFVEINNEPCQFGAASALAARLLEARAAGLV